MRLGDFIRATSEAGLNEDTGLFSHADNYAEISTRLRRAGYRLLRRHHHARIWMKVRHCIMVYVRGEAAMTEYLKFCKTSTNKHTPRITRGPVDISPRHTAVGFEYIDDISQSRWNKVKGLEDYSQTNDEADEFEDIQRDYPSLWRLMGDLHRRGYFRRFDYDLSRDSWMESRTWPILFAPFWTTRAGMFRESTLFEYLDWGIEGFWIGADGQRIQTGHGQRHADIVLAKIPNVSQEDADHYYEARERGDSSYDMRIVDYGLREGWIRVLEPDSGEFTVEYRSGISAKPAWSTLQRYVSRGIDHPEYVFAEPGQEAHKFHRKAEALRFIGAMMR